MARARIRIARHEAGHAVMALTCPDVTFEAVTIVPYVGNVTDKKTGKVKEHRAAGGVTQMGGYASTRQWVLIDVAGLAGSRIDCKTAGEFDFALILGECNHDWKNATETLRDRYDLKGKEMDDEVDFNLNSAWRMLRSPDLRPAHDLITEVLMEKNTISFDEAKALFDLASAG